MSLSSAFAPYKHLIAIAIAIDAADDKVSPCRLIPLPLLHLQVIYALNTKNDEHEEELESLKEAHEDEVRVPNGAACKKEKGILYWSRHCESLKRRLFSRVIPGPFFKK